MKKLLLSASILLSSLILQAQTQIDFGTFVTLRPDLTNQGSSYQRDIVTDPNGNVFGVGNTNITQVPKGTVQGNVVDSTFGGGQWDGYVYKLAADGKSLLWWTYLGGAGNDDIWGVDYSKEGANEYIYCTGFTDKTISVSASTVVKGTYKGQRDAFLAKYNALTGELVWLSWLGSTKDDCGFNVKVSTNYIHIVGYASKGIATTTGAYKTTLVDDWTYDGFYSKFDFSGNINYCSYTNFPSPFMDINSGNGANGARGLDIISDNDVIISGTTNGNDITTEKNNTTLKVSGNLPSIGEVGFVLRLNTLAGGANDYLFGSKIRTKASGAYTFATDIKYNNGSFYVLGYSNGVISNIPTGAYQETNAGATDIFILKIKASDYSIENASMYGGAGNDYASELTVCSSEPTFSGQTASNNLVVVNYLTTGALSSPTRNLNTLKGGGNDMFTASLKNDFKSLSFSSYLGGSLDEHPFTSYFLYGKPGGLAINGNKLLIGASSHSFQDFPTTIGSLHHVTETVSKNITSPDLDFVVSFQKPGGSCSLIQTFAPDLDIDALNDSATGKDYKTTYIENATSISVVNTNSGGVTITDSDDTNIKSAIITLTNTQANDVFTVIGTLPSGITSVITTSGTNTIINLTGSATKANYQTALTLIKFSNTSDNPNTTDRNITFQVTDNSSSTVSNTAITTIKVKAVNDNPILDLDINNNSGKTGADFQTVYTEKSFGVNIADNDISSSDIDSPNLTSATIILTNKKVGDYLVLGTLTGITATVDSSILGKITISLSGSTTLVNYENAIKSITYKNGSLAPDATTRIITVNVNDGASVNNLSNTATSFINFELVNDCPIVDLNTTTAGNNDVATFTENASAINITSSNISISDPDKTTQTWNVKVELTNTFALDSLLKPANIGGLIISNPDYMSIPGRISITISGSGTGNQLATAINGIKFKTASENPNITPRNINIEISDDAIPACKVSAVSTININAKNDCPIVDLNTNSLGNDYLTVFVEQGVKVNVTSSNISITDVDNTIQKWNSTVELSNAVSLDSLFSSVTVSGFTVSPVSYTSGKVTVNITGTGTGVQLSSIIKGITYKSSSLNPDVTTRNIVVSISDDSSCTTSANSLITINLVVIDNDTITFQDFAFKSALISLGIDKNADNKIQKKEVDSIKKLNISSKSISNLAGIEWFKALDSLNVSFNNLTNINLSALVNLTYLNASNNKLSDVSITNFANQRVSTVAPNTKLQTLLVNNNQLTKLDVSNLLALKVLDARVNSALFQVCVNPSHDLTNFKVDLTTTLTSTCGILTSIENELNLEPKTLVGIYNLIGQKIENEQATNGIYIFVYSDGSREKVLR